MPSQLPIINISTDHQILIEQLLAKKKAGEEAAEHLRRLIVGIRDQSGAVGIPYSLRGSQLVPDTPTVAEFDAILAQKAPAEHPHTINLHDHIHPEEGAIHGKRRTKGR